MERRGGQRRGKSFLAVTSSGEGKKGWAYDRTGHEEKTPWGDCLRGEGGREVKTTPTCQGDE